MMDPVEKQQIQEANRTIGNWLRRLRESKALKRRSVVKVESRLTGAKLRKYERGQSALPVSILASLVKQYEGDALDFQMAIMEATNGLRAIRERRSLNAFPKISSPPQSDSTSPQP